MHIGSRNYLIELYTVICFFPNTSSEWSHDSYPSLHILTEVGIIADRLAVDEETVRLRSHFAQLRKILESTEPVGRKLDFLVQEMNRETNTIGSKCSDTAIAGHVVEMKSELEKIREQIQNIE